MTRSTFKYIFLFLGALSAGTSCKKFEYTIPELTTGTATASYRSASCSSTLVSDGGQPITSRGLCFATHPAPTLADNYTPFFPSYYQDDPTIVSWAGPMQPDTRYYIRPYATNSIGTAYGDQVIINTLPYQGTVNDIDGNTYHIVTIGSQQWLAEDLRTMRYSNGDSIYYVNSNLFWNSMDSGAYCEYNFSLSQSADYGKLYNWHAVADSRKLAPMGWHVATYNEWQALINYLGGNAKAALKLIECGTAHWTIPNSATNEFGFTALPGGRKINDNSNFEGIGNEAYWWTSTAAGSSTAYAVLLNRACAYSYCNLEVYYYYYGISRKYGFPVRCVKD